LPGHIAGLYVVSVTTDRCGRARRPGVHSRMAWAADRLPLRPRPRAVQRQLGAPRSLATAATKPFCPASARTGAGGEWWMP